MRQLQVRMIVVSQAGRRRVTSFGECHYQIRSRALYRRLESAMARARVLRACMIRLLRPSVRVPPSNFEVVPKMLFQIKDARRGYQGLHVQIFQDPTIRRVHVVILTVVQVGSIVEKLHACMPTGHRERVSVRLPIFVTRNVGRASHVEDVTAPSVQVGNSLFNYDCVKENGACPPLILRTMGLLRNRFLSLQVVRRRVANFLVRSHDLRYRGYPCKVTFASQDNLLLQCIFLRCLVAIVNGVRVYMPKRIFYHCIANERTSFRAFILRAYPISIR